MAASFTVDRWESDSDSPYEIEVRVSEDADQQLLDSVLELASSAATRLTSALNLSAPSVRVEHAPGLAPGEYEIGASGVVRFAGSVSTPWRVWWNDHPAAGPGGRTGVAGGPATTEAAIDAAPLIARSVEEVLFDDLGLLLRGTSAVAVAGGLFAPFGDDIDATSWGETLRGLATYCVPLPPAEELVEAAGDVDADGPLARLEHLACRFRRYRIVGRLGQQLHEEIGAGNRSSRLHSELIPYLHDGLFAEVGVAFPVIELELDEELEPRGYELSIADVPRARGSVPEGRALVNVAPDDARVLMPASSGEKEPVGFVLPTGGFGSWIESAPPAPYWITWDATEFIVLHLASILREAAREFADLAWVQQLFERFETDLELYDLSRSVTEIYSREFVAAVLGRLSAQGVTIRDVELVLERMLDYAGSRSSSANGAAPSPVPEVLDVVEHVRAGMKERLAHAAAHSWDWSDDGALRTVTREVPAFVLSTKDEEAVAGVAAGKSREAVYGYRAAPLLRALRRALEEWGGPSPPAVITSRRVRPHVRRVIAAQFPRVKVLVEDELAADVRLERLGELASAEGAAPTAR
jgi:hypothetical protein